MSFSVVVSVGPGPRERPRLFDLLTALSICEGAARPEVLLIDDGAHLRAPELAGQSFSRLPIRIVPSPRAGLGDHWRGGLVTNILCGFKQCRLDAGTDFILKLDTDTMVIRPFAEEISRRLRAHSRVGLLGSAFRRNLHGGEISPSDWRVNLAKWLAPIRLRRNPFPRVETAWWGRNRRIRRLIRSAVQQGWPLGHCAQGGGYAVRGDLLRHWRDAGYLADDFLWRHTDLGEDIVSALLCYAAGHEIEDYNAPGEPFGVQFHGLAFSPAEYFERGYAIVHSVKADEPHAELHLRRQFLEPLQRLSALG